MTGTGASDVGAVFVLPVTTAGQRGPVAAFVSTAGWANAARRVVGASWIVTPTGPIDPDTARATGSASNLAQRTGTSVRSHIPPALKTAVKDVRAWRRAHAFHVDAAGPWDGHGVRFVWQRHELFHTAGLDLADALGVPSVLFAPATIVWEARQWGVTRPGWAKLAERAGEVPSLRRATIVACGSEMVAAQARRLGTPDDRILVTPTGVDLDTFAGAAARREETRGRLGLTGFVVGWVGSFRRFHALDQIVEAAAKAGDVTLLLVGDGPERPEIERLATRLGVTAVFTGTVAHADIPSVIGAMDAALVVARPGEAFHYSPLKLAEYLAASVPVVAPRVPQLEARLTDGVDAVLVEPGDMAALADAIVALRDDDDRRRTIALSGRHAAEAHWSWDEQVRRVIAALDRPRR